MSAGDYLGDSIENLMRSSVTPGHGNGSKSKGGMRKVRPAFTHVDRAAQDVMPTVNLTDEDRAELELQRSAARIDGGKQSVRPIVRLSAYAGERESRAFQRARQRYGKLASFSRYARVVARIVEMHDIMPSDLARLFDVEAA